MAVTNLDGVGPGQLKLTGELLADIYLGKIQNWADPAIKALNPDLKLPDAKIVLVHRSDGSGTTYNFTNYLSKMSPQWRDTVGFDLLVKWPSGTGAKGNDGVSRTVRADQKFDRLCRIRPCDSNPPQLRGDPQPRRTIRGADTGALSGRRRQRGLGPRRW